MNRKTHGEPLRAIPARAFQRELGRLLGRTLARRWIGPLRRLGRLPDITRSAKCGRRKEDA